MANINKIFVVILIIYHQTNIFIQLRPKRRTSRLHYLRQYTNKHFYFRD